MLPRALDSPAPAIEDVRVDHRRLHARVAEQFLHRADVVAGLQEMRRERVTKDVRRDGLVDCRAERRIPHRALDRLLV